MLEMVEYAERVPKVNNGNMWKDSEVLRSIVWLFILLRLCEGLEAFTIYLKAFLLYNYLLLETDFSKSKSKPG